MTNEYQGYIYDPYRSNPSAGRRARSEVTVIVNQPSESAPLLLRRTRRAQMTMPSLHPVAILCLVLALSTVAFQTWQNWMHFLYCPPDPATRVAMRNAWERERAQHDHLSRQWAREREEQDQDRERWRREVEERERREEEERQRRHMFWGHVQPHTCTTYATREYTAQLMNLPRNWGHRLDACRATPLEIRGISYLPKTCEDRGPGFVIGRWGINEREPDCTTFWDEYHDKGCSSPGSGKKYITHKLMNLPDDWKKADWKEFCATTPAYFNNMQFPGAQECFTSVFGVYGQWEIDDSNC